MNELKLLFQHFDLLMDSPDSIKKMRELILQLAVQGKLVAQNPEDEPASELLKRIKAEKERLIKEGKIKKSAPLPPISEDEIPFRLSSGWEWIRFGEYSIIERGGSPRPIKDYITEETDGLNWIKIGDTQKGSKYITETKEKIRKEGLKKTRKVFPGDFLLTNSMSFGRPYITTIEGCIHDGWLRIHPPKDLDKDFLYLLLSSTYVKDSFIKSAAGAVVQNLNSDKVRELLIPLPPLPAQKRIVEKVNHLMALCDELEKKQNRKLQDRITLNTSATHHLMNAKTDAEFTTLFALIRNNFDQLYDNPDNIKNLKQTILQLAVQGKLVAQNPEDEPASELLKRIKAEKERLIAEGKIKKSAPLPPISEDEIPYEVPEGWVWCRLRTICHEWGQKKPDKNFTYIDVASIDNGRGIISEDLMVLSPDQAPSRARKIVRPGTLIYSTVRPYLLNIAVVEKDYNPEPIVSTAFAIISLLADINVYFIYHFLRSTTFIDYVNGAMKGMAYPAVNDSTFFSGLIPLPPLPAQKRIVEKVNHLMALCDELDMCIQAQSDKNEKLMSAILS